MLCRSFKYHVQFRKYRCTKLRPFFESCCISILEDAVTVLSLNFGNPVIIDAASCLSKVTLLVFIDYSMYKRRLTKLTTLLRESSNYKRKRNWFLSLKKKNWRSFMYHLLCNGLYEIRNPTAVYELSPQLVGKWLTEPRIWTCSLVRSKQREMQLTVV